MRAKIIIGFILVFILSVFTAGAKESIAVLNFKNYGVSKDKVELIRQYLESNLVESKRYSVVERRDLEKVVKEYELSQSGLSESSSAVEVGKLLNATKIIMGSVTKYSTKYIDYVILVKVVSVVTGEIIFSKTFEIRKNESIKTVVDKISKELLTGIKKKYGMVSFKSGNNVFVTLGKSDDIKEGEILYVLNNKIVRNEKGEALFSEEEYRGKVEVVAVNDEISKCKILEDNGIEKKCVVKREFNIGSKKKAGLTIVTIPDGAKIYVDGNYIGISPIQFFDLDIGKHKIEIKKSGFKDIDLSVNFKKEKTIKLVKELKVKKTVEDFLLSEYVPRIPKDPTKAALKALIPGRGYYYNEYRVAGTILPLSIVEKLFLISTGFNNDPIEEPGTDANFWDVKRYCIGDDNDSIRYQMLGMVAFEYIYSIIDSYFSAKSEKEVFHYTELKMNVKFLNADFKQTEDGNVPDNINSVIAGDRKKTSGFLDMMLSYKSSSYNFDFGFAFGANGDFWIGIENGFRIKIYKNFALLLGGKISGSPGSGGGNDYGEDRFKDGNFETDGGPISFLDGVYGGFSFFGKYTDINLKYYPRILVSGAMLVIPSDMEAIYRGESISSDHYNYTLEYTMLKKATALSFDITHYFWGNTGLYLDGEFVNAEYDDEQKERIDKYKITNIESFSMFSASLGVAVRF